MSVLSGVTKCSREGWLLDATVVQPRDNVEWEKSSLGARAAETR
jgi:hypothetical protein